MEHNRFQLHPTVKLGQKLYSIDMKKRVEISVISRLRYF